MHGGEATGLDGVVCTKVRAKKREPPVPPYKPQHCEYHNGVGMPHLDGQLCDTQGRESPWHTGKKRADDGNGMLGFLL